ncbi:GntR family transcriptional regulator [Prosthecomicrobium sp. N25]|uniref:GntR family transcriptional regulator n=1 Tax=Prosthecomicrobium sp. N25 TaxID=3129254 RepID=UPI0030776FC9
MPLTLDKTAVGPGSGRSRPPEKPKGPGPSGAEPSAAAPIHDQVYGALREALVTGRIVPGRAVTLRGLAANLGVSPMPVREAIRRISAEGGLVVQANRRVSVPDMTAERFDELVRARSLLEPEAAARALPHIDAARLKRIVEADDQIEQALQSGDVEGYMAANHRFHFEIYRAAPSTVLVPMIESLWLRFGPFMRRVYGRYGTAILIDQHERAIAAIRGGDEAGLRAAIRADILDGMNEIGASGLDP